MSHTGFTRQTETRTSHAHTRYEDPLLCVLRRGTEPGPRDRPASRAESRRAAAGYLAMRARHRYEWRYAQSRGWMGYRGDKYGPGF